MDVFQQKNVLLKILKIAFEICQPKFTPKIMKKYFLRSSFLVSVFQKLWFQVLDDLFFGVALGG